MTRRWVWDPSPSIGIYIKMFAPVSRVKSYSMARPRTRLEARRGHDEDDEMMSCDLDFSALKPSLLHEVDLMLTHKVSLDRGSILVLTYQKNAFTAPD